MGGQRPEVLLPVRANLEPPAEGEDQVASPVTAPRSGLTVLSNDVHELVLADGRRESDALEEEVHGRADGRISVMNGRHRILSTTSKKARVQTRGALSLRGVWARLALPCLGGAPPGLLLGLLMGLFTGCAGSGAGREEAVIPPEPSLAGTEVILARYVIDQAAGGESRCSVELDVLTPGGSRQTFTRVLSWQGVGESGAWLPDGLGVDDRALVSVRTADSTWRSPIAIPLGSVDPHRFVAAPRHPGPAGDESAAAFARYCERLTLHRDPMGGAPAPGGIASAWFGELVAGTSDEAPSIVLTLADVTVALFGREEESLAGALVEAGWHVPSADAAWATPRWLGLHDIVGAAAFRDALRGIVGTHAGGAPIGVAEVADAFESDAAKDFVSTWFRGPAHGRVESSWRHDASRSRILLRVDQIHEIENDAVAAYVFTLPIVVVTEGGDKLEHDVTVERRRELFEIPCEGVPVGVRLDADGTLAGRIEFVSASGPEASSGGA